MTDVFISYARADRPNAERIADELEQHGWSVWWDRKILGGETFDQTIQKALNDARCVVVLWSAASIDSGWVKDEAADGKRRNILVPVIVDDVEIPIGFRQLQAVTILGAARETDRSKFADLLASVDAVLRRTREQPAAATVSRPAPQRSPETTPAPRTVPRWMLYIALALIVILGTWVIWQQMAGGHRDGQLGTPQTAGGSSVTRPGDATGTAGTSGLPPAASGAGSTSGPRAAEPMQQVAADAAELVVSGSGQDFYEVYDAAGEKHLKTVRTSVAVELFPGNYLLVINGTRRSATVTQARRTIVASGSITVVGSGEDFYSAWDKTGKTSLGTRRTSVSIELFPGDYTVELNGSRVPASVQAGGNTSLAAGSIEVAGSGEDFYSAWDKTGKTSLGTRRTKVSIELFPGDYTLELNGSRVPASVQAGRSTSLAAGSIVVAGSGEGFYSAYDKTGKTSLGTRRTKVSIELFPGDYVVELNEIRREVRVDAGKQTVANR